MTQKKDGETARRLYVIDGNSTRKHGPGHCVFMGDIYSEMVRTRHVLQSLDAVVHGLLLSLRHEIRSIDTMTAQFEHNMGTPKPKRKAVKK